MNELYVVNENGEKVEIILPIEKYEKMKEDLHDLLSLQKDVTRSLLVLKR
jgi:PHD/YefM family antitoxin component YafN of YafNO toxin-antitoxin module